ncbi:MAG: type II toxin-antitoxin system VapC family toxin [Thermoproteales archaeon]|nr:type II toxin-antitoxin system VapC family toxin [Thermoproteales archaeon]
MKYLFDTKALIAFFNDEDGAEFVYNLLKGVDEDKIEGFISSITLTEIYYLYRRKVGEKIARKRVEQIRLSNLKIVPIDEEIALKAGEYKVKAIPIADALIAATAYSIGAKVVTDDKHFEGLDIKVVKFR